MQNSPLFSIYKSFAGGNIEMDGRQFAKMMKDVGLVDKKKFTATDVDLIFAKAKDKSQRKVTFHQFEKALQLVAAKKDYDVDGIIAIIEAAGGPKF
mmetsp:Transcript_16431/g.14116  ORF Transcript_16431/g.14116 Transcript_16431/m.14116 type:complete len:96 (+) Transcript_16431:92-379(+)